MAFRKTASLTLWCCVFSFFASTLVQAAQAVRVQVDQRGDFILLGNSFGQECAAGTPAPLVGTLGACGAIGTADSAPDVFWRSDSPTAGSAEANDTILPANARSTAVLNLPPGAQVTHAYLYWSATLGTTGSDGSATVDRPGGFSVPVNAVSVMTGPNSSYLSVADVTALVQANGAGAYRVSGVDIVNWVNITNSNHFAGWWMVVLYERSSDPMRRLAVYDGLDGVSGTTPQSVTVSGFVVPPVPGVSKLGVVAMDGDNSGVGDALSVNGNAKSDAQNPVSNFFNSSRSHLGNPVSVAGDLPQQGGGPQSMNGMDLDVVDISADLVPGQTSFPIGLTTAGDVYFLTTLAVSVPTLTPDLGTSRMTAINLDGKLDSAEPGDLIQYSVEVVNIGDDGAAGVVFTDVLPAGVTYVPGSIAVVTGPNAGAKTDAAGDDQAEYDDVTRTVVMRLGTGANATQGGQLANFATTLLRFRATVDRDCAAPVNIANQGSIQASGQSGAPLKTYLTDGNGNDPGNPPNAITVAKRCLTVNVTGAGSGTIVSTPAGISCRTSCQLPFGADTVVALNAVRDADSIFTGWSGAHTGLDNPLLVALGNDVSVTATFLLSQTITNFSATPSAPLFAPGGTFAVSATGGGSGQPVTFASNSPDQCSVTAATVTMLEPGVCMLEANQAGNAQYTSAFEAYLDVPMLTDHVFDNGFESGDTLHWKLVAEGAMPAARLSNDPVNALLGGGGLDVSPLGIDGDAIYLEQTVSDAVRDYRAQFVLAPDGVRIGDAITVAAGIDAEAGAAIELRLGPSAGGGYVLTLAAGEHGGRTAMSSVAIPDRPQRIEIDWSAARDTQPGHALLSIDGRRVAQLTRLDNGRFALKRVRVGAVEGVDQSVRGRYRLRDFVTAKP